MRFCTGTHRPTTDFGNAELGSLYRGAGGEDANAVIITTIANNEAGLLPSYEASMSNKDNSELRRKRTADTTLDDSILLTKKLNVGRELTEESLQSNLENYLESLIGAMEVRLRNELRNELKAHSHEMTNLIRATEIRLRNDFMGELKADFHETKEYIRHVKRDLKERIDFKIKEDVNGSMEELITDT
ncbi:hypothetical protein TrVFT333_000073 [Trichoderma virens FT-333]|nr:hypothetical protein TrVFT333_000073 [Trichoderma virens FT-333]